MNENRDKIGLYIHIPFCSAKCGYCDFASFGVGEKNNGQKQREYVDAIRAEIRQRAEQPLKIDTVFVGGGTPSALYNGGLGEIITEVRRHFCIDENLEFTVEANPETVSAEFAGEVKAIGANRISLGLQTASDRLLKNLRRHTFADFLQAVELFRSEGIANISADLMLGLPNQRLSDVTDSLERILELQLPHISAYGLRVEQGTPLATSGFCANDDEIAAFYKAVRETLCGDYEHYEVSNFARRGYECRHNQKYWQMQPYLGVGLNASSFDGNKRRTNTRDFDRYLSRNFDDFCEDAKDNFLTEYMMLGLRTNQGIDLEILKKHGYNTQNPALQKYLTQGILWQNGNNLRLNPDYYFVMNTILTDIIYC